MHRAGISARRRRWDPSVSRGARELDSARGTSISLWSRALCARSELAEKAQRASTCEACRGPRGPPSARPRCTKRALAWSSGLPERKQGQKGEGDAGVRCRGSFQRSRSTPVAATV